MRDSTRMNRTPAFYLSVGLLAVGAVASFEGYRSVAYDDGAGVQTLGFGSTHHPDGRAVSPGDRVTPPQAVQMLAQDLHNTGHAIARCIGDVPLYPYEFDAFASLAYNIGSGAFCRSTLVKKLKESPPDYPGACAQILRWNRAGGVVMPGLTKRRSAEYRLCMGQAAAETRP